VTRTPKSPKPSKRDAAADGSAPSAEPKKRRAATGASPGKGRRKATSGQASSGGEHEASAEHEGEADGGPESSSGESQEGADTGGEDLDGGGPESEPVSTAEPEGDVEGDAGDGDTDSSLDAPTPAETGGSITRFDPMAAYLREVQRHPLLTPEQTHEIAVRFLQTQDTAAAAQLVTSNLRLVVKIAYEYRRAYKNIMDLVQEGNIGLMQAVKRYDPYRGVKLSSYAAWWIRAYILRFILNNWRLVKLGTTQAQRKLFFNLRKKRAELVAMGIDPTDQEVAKQLNVPVSDVADMEVRLQQSEKSLDAPVGDAEGRSIARVDMMPSVWDGPETLLADEEVQALLKEKLAEFRKTLAGKEKELAIFDERLVADEPLTLQELGDRFGISRERVRQLEQRLTSRLREYLKGEMGDAAEAG
jgi:RNA polymerase sigma-32 factor